LTAYIASKIASIIFILILMVKTTIFLKLVYRDLIFQDLGINIDIAKLILKNQEKSRKIDL